MFRFETDGEAIAMANDTPFGLAAYLYSRDAARIWRTAARIESGMVGINCAAHSAALERVLSGRRLRRWRPAGP